LPLPQAVSAAPRRPPHVRPHGGRPGVPSAADTAAAHGRGGRKPGRGGRGDADRAGRPVLRAVDGTGAPTGGDPGGGVPGAAPNDAGPREEPRMTGLRFLTAGESHGPELVIVVE